MSLIKVKSFFKRKNDILTTLTLHNITNNKLYSLNLQKT